MHRPIYHFLPEKNWMNDPNGVSYYKGEYHLFYQYNPTGPEWGNLHWGHARSRDCVHWEHMPVALAPSVGQGEIHCFSGCAEVTGEYPMIFYTSVGEGRRDARVGAQQWAAVSHDDMVSWEKIEENPIMTAAMHGDIQVLDWRDPFVWQEDGFWFMVLGAAYEDRGCALIYRSPDRYAWEFLGILKRAEKEEENIWECPNYFFLGDKRVLVISPNGAPRYMIGSQNEQYQFEEESGGYIDRSGWEGFYAPNSFVDGKGRRIMIGWLTEGSRGDLEIPDWQGAQSVPRVLTLEEGVLYMRPIEELKALRGKSWEMESPVTLSGQPEQKLESGLSGKSVEILLELKNVCEDTMFDLEFLASSDGGEKTVLHYEGKTDTLTLDRSMSSKSGKTKTNSLECHGTHTQAGRMKLQLFLDRSTVEVFINDREVISSRVYPMDVSSSQIILINKAAGLQADTFRVFEMKTIW